MWGTPNGNKLLIMLQETALPHELIPVNLGKKEQLAPSYLRINPNGKIPAIRDRDAIGGGTLTLFESGAILIYLAEKCGRFLPADAAGRYATLQWLMLQMSGIGPMIGQFHHFLSSAPQKIDYALERYRDESRRLLAVIDAQLANSSYLVGGEYTIADIATWPWVRSWQFTVRQTLADFPAVARWFAMLEQRPAVQRAMQIYERLRAQGSAVPAAS